MMRRDVGWRLRMTVKVDMRRRARGVCVKVNMLTAPVFPEHIDTQKNQHQSDRKFQRKRHLGWNRHPEHENANPCQQERNRMADSPQHSDPCRLQETSVFTDNGRHGEQMIRIQSVLQAQNKTKTDGQRKRSGHAGSSTRSSSGFWVATPPNTQNISTPQKNTIPHSPSAPEAMPFPVQEYRPSSGPTRARVPGVGQAEGDGTNGFVSGRRWAR